MKYIRTKDGIFEVLEIYTYTKKKLGVIIESLGCKTENENELKTIFYGDVLKQANTIEELCDVIVCNEKLFYPLTSNREGNEFNWEEIISCSHNAACNADYKGKAEDLYFNIYGAIWTDKGLIYVAKVNEKGEWELI